MRQGGVRGRESKRGGAQASPPSQSRSKTQKTKTRVKMRSNCRGKSTDGGGERRKSGRRESATHDGVGPPQVVPQPRERGRLAAAEAHNAALVRVGRLRVCGGGGGWVEVSGYGYPSNETRSLCEERNLPPRRRRGSSGESPRSRGVGVSSTCYPPNPPSPPYPPRGAPAPPPRACTRARPAPAQRPTPRRSPPPRRRAGGPSPLRRTPRGRACAGPPSSPPVGVELQLELELDKIEVFGVSGSQARRGSEKRPECER